jgi:hypothetical protein
MSRRPPHLSLLLVLAACAGADDPGADEMTAPLFDVKTGAQGFHASASGEEEVPPRPTNAVGNATFRLSDDGTELHYKLSVANIENVVQAHIHLAPRGVNGNIVAFLYGLVASGGGRVDGVLAEGTITDADLINDLAGMTIADLVAAIKAGNTYVNVHTNDGVGAINTGPGDFPGGEVRGQIGGGHTRH